MHPKLPTILKANTLLSNNHQSRCILPGAPFSSSRSSFSEYVELRQVAKYRTLQFWYNGITPHPIDIKRECDCTSAGVPAFKCMFSRLHSGSGEGLQSLDNIHFGAGWALYPDYANEDEYICLCSQDSKFGARDEVDLINVARDSSRSNQTLRIATLFTPKR